MKYKLKYKTFEQKITDKSYLVFLEVDKVDDTEINEKVTDVIESIVVEKYRDLTTDNGENISYVDCSPAWLHHSQCRLLIIGIDKIATNENHIMITDEDIENLKNEKVKEQ